MLAAEIALLVVFSSAGRSACSEWDRSKFSEERCSPYEEQEGEPREKTLLKKTKEHRIARLSHKEAEILPLRSIWLLNMNGYREATVKIPGAR